MKLTTCQIQFGGNKQFGDGFFTPMSIEFHRGYYDEKTDNEFGVYAVRTKQRSITNVGVISDKAFYVHDEILGEIFKGMNKNKLSKYFNELLGNNKEEAISVEKYRK